MLLYLVPLHDWPGNSPDLNPIESIWRVIEREIGDIMPSMVSDMWKRVCDAPNSSCKLV